MKSWSVRPALPVLYAGAPGWVGRVQPLGILLHWAKSIINQAALVSEVRFLDGT